MPRQRPPCPTAACIEDAHPEDPVLFAIDQVPVLRSAVGDLSWLLSHGYADVAATKLVGDRFQLEQRQRVAVRRCACSDAQRATRTATKLPPSALASERIVVDTFNVLTTLEAALAGGVILTARDGCRRDMASMHGSWRRVQETEIAIDRLVEALAAATLTTVTFILDRPVGNSGRLAAMIRAAAAGRIADCSVELHDGADRALLAQGGVIATADSAVLDRARSWLDLPGALLPSLAPAAWIVDLAADSSAERGERVTDAGR